MNDSTITPDPQPRDARTSFVPGAYFGMPMREYLNIPAVSQGILQTMLDRCSKAAWYESWLNPARVRDDNPVYDNGTVAHAILLEGNADCVAVIDPRDHPAEKTGAIPDGWTNKSIRTARDSARAAGKIPMLLGDMRQIAEMVAAAMEFIEECRYSEPSVYQAFQPSGGHSEVTITWDDAGVPCRIRTDRITTDFAHVIDYKTGAVSVEPDYWGRAKYANAGLYVGAAFYQRGIRAQYGVECSYTYLAQENEPPYLCSLIGVDPEAFAIGDQKIAHALAMWRKCCESGRWPGYTNRVAYPSLPQYIGLQWSEREIDQVWK
jgi:PDDEXK-like domain of unknown function (DUF3799)